MKFEYFDGQQRTPEWFALRRGKVTASRLDDWLSVSKAKATLGKPLKKRLDYEKELLFERQFGRSFEMFVNSAMQDGIDFEPFVRQQYEKINKVLVEECGAWYNDVFVASPDGMIADVSDKPAKGTNNIGLLEVKVLRDNSFTEVLVDGVPDKHWKQCQGQLWASGALWCDYVAANLSTKKIKVIRVEPDEEFHKWLELAVPEPISSPPLSTVDVFDFKDEIAPVNSQKIIKDLSDSNF